MIQISAWKRTFARFCAAGALVSVAACGGGSSGTTVIDYTGTWDVRYNFTVDECSLVLPEIPGIVDQHSIVQNGDEISLEAKSLLIISDTGSVRDDGTMVAESVIAGDIFGDGTQCELGTVVSYQEFNADEDSAQSLFRQSIVCNDGYSCESQGVGQAVRQPTA